MLKRCGGSNELPRAEGFSKKVDWGIVMLVHSGQKKKLGVGDQGLKQVLLLDTADSKGEKAWTRKPELTVSCWCLPNRLSLQFWLFGRYDLTSKRGPW